MNSTGNRLSSTNKDDDNCGELDNGKSFFAIYGRGLNVLLAGAGSRWKPHASNTGKSSRTRPGMEPSSKRLWMSSKLDTVLTLRNP